MQANPAKVRPIVVLKTPLLLIADGLQVVFMDVVDGIDACAYRINERLPARMSGVE